MDGIDAESPGGRSLTFDEVIIKYVDAQGKEPPDGTLKLIMIINRLADGSSSYRLLIVVVVFHTNE